MEVSGSEGHRSNIEAQLRQLDFEIRGYQTRRTAGAQNRPRR